MIVTDSRSVCIAIVKAATNAILLKSRLLFFPGE